MRRPPELDAQVAAGKHLPGRWFLVGLAQVLLPVLSVAAVVLVLVLFRPPHGDVALGLYSLSTQLATGVGIWVVARSLARRYGGWRAAFGFAPPSLLDLPVAAGWALVQLVARVVVAGVLVALVPGLGAHGGNTEGLSRLSPGGLVLALLGAVVVAPVLEELAFRGIVLRGLMRRMPFWPAAVVSSVLFGSLHVLGVAHLAGIPLLVAGASVFGFLQCVLVRLRGGRLGGAMVAHGVSNLLTTLLVLASGG